MLLERLCLSNMRGLQDLDLRFEPGTNFIVGSNGSGKSTILESIYLLSSGFSFRTHLLRELITHGADGLFVEATIRHENHKKTLSLSFDGENRRISIGGVHVEKTSQLLGQLLSTISTHEDLHFFFGAPSDRRRELDLLIAQNSPEYITLLTRYNRVVQQRNRLLRDKDFTTLIAWDAQLTNLSPQITLARAAQLATIVPLFLEELQWLLPELCKRISIRFLPSVEEGADFLALLERKRDQEIRASTSLVGAHRDELCIYLDAYQAKKCLSMGQAKAVIFAFRLASWRLLHTQTGVAPIFLLDDIESFLSAELMDRVMERLATMDQAIISFLPTPKTALLSHLIPL